VKFAVRVFRENLCIGNHTLLRDLNNFYLTSRIHISVSIATDYGLDGPGSNPGVDEIFRPSRPALGLTQPPVQWVPCFPGSKVRSGRAADHSPPSSVAVMEE